MMEELADLQLLIVISVVCLIIWGIIWCSDQEDAWKNGDDD